MTVVHIKHTWNIEPVVHGQKDTVVHIWQCSDICCCRAARYAAAKASLQHAPADISILSNLPAAHLKLQEWKLALVRAQSVLRCEPGHFKYLCHAGVAHMHLENCAIASLQAATELAYVEPWWDLLYCTVSLFRCCNIHCTLGA